MKVNCLHPNIILNPLLPELVSQFGNYWIRGVETKLSYYRNLLYDFKPKKLNPHSLKITSNDICSCFVVDYNSGQTYPVYLEVPCGHCEICKNAKVNAFVHRCKLETQLYNSKPLFITLTYDELHKKECGVCLRDVQLFLKRLRQNLFRRGYCEKIRYVLVSEYGRKTHRPHYHAILWNLRQTDILSYCEIRGILKKSWSNGFVMQRLIDPRNDKAFYYTSKYLRKDCDVPNRCNKTFLLSSNRGGGIGAKFIDGISEQIEKRLNIRCRYVNKWSNKTEQIQFNRYILNRVVPTLSRSFPYSVKKRVRRFVLNYEILKNRKSVNQYVFEEKAKIFLDFFGKYFYIPQLEFTEIKTSMEDSTDSILRQMLEDENEIQRAMSKGREYYNRAVRLDERRQVFLSKLFMIQEDVDLPARAYNYRRINAMAAQREIF